MYCGYYSFVVQGTGKLPVVAFFLKMMLDLEILTLNLF